MAYKIFVLSAIVMAVSVNTFHLQNDPREVARVCNGFSILSGQGWNNYICRMVGMRCRGNQNFDADSVHAVCDLVSRRTCGITPMDIYRGARITWNRLFWCSVRG